MLETLISSKTRIKLLLRFFLNPSNTAHLRGLAEEFAESTNSIRVELNRFEEAGMLTTESSGNKKLYKANNKHPLFKDLQSILLKYVGLDRVVDLVINRIGKLEKVYLTGDYARGIDSGIIDLVFVGDIDKEYLVSLISKIDKLIGRKCRYLIYGLDEWQGIEETNGKALLLWENNMN
jgi:hypothetical protein